MEDNLIIELYFDRDEQAITETDLKYGSYIRRIASNILGQWQDAEECVNDTYHAAWNAIPPEKPSFLSAFLGRITRNISISHVRAKTAQKRYIGTKLLLSELSECIPDKNGPDTIIDGFILSELISRWLDSLSLDDRALFVRRYWYGDACFVLAEECGCSTNQISKRMYRLRKGLKAFLESEGVTL